MRILRNYILNECVLPFLTCLGVLTFVFLLGYLPQLANKVINKGISLSAVAMALLYNVPVLLGYTLPIAALAAIIITFGQLSSDNEIIAIRASGIPLIRLLLPLITVGFILSSFLWVLNDRIIPNASHAQRELLINTSAKNPGAILEAGTFIDNFNGSVLFIYRIDRNRLYNIRIYQPQPGGKPTRTIIAQEGEFTPVPGEKKLEDNVGKGFSQDSFSMKFVKRDKLLQNAAVLSRSPGLVKGWWMTKTVSTDICVGYCADMARAMTAKRRRIKRDFLQAIGANSKICCRSMVFFAQQAVAWENKIEYTVQECLYHDGIVAHDVLRCQKSYLLLENGSLGFKIKIGREIRLLKELHVQVIQRYRWFVISAVGERAVGFCLVRCAAFVGRIGSVGCFG